MIAVTQIAGPVYASVFTVNSTLEMVDAIAQCERALEAISIDAVSPVYLTANCLSTSVTIDMNNYILKSPLIVDRLFI